MGTKGFFQFENIINVLVTCISFCFIRIPMLWVNGKLAIVEIVFIQCTIRNLTYKDGPRAGRVLR